MYLMIELVDGWSRFKKVEKYFYHFEISCNGSFGEPVVDRLKQFPRVGGMVLIEQQTAGMHADGKSMRALARCL